MYVIKSFATKQSRQIHGFPLTPSQSHFNIIRKKKHLFHSISSPKTRTSTLLYPVTTKPQLYEKLMPMVTPNVNLARREIEQVISSFRAQFDLIIHAVAGCNVTFIKPVHFRAMDIILARIATETPQRGTTLK